jgi:hypothetical protein
MAKKSNKAWAGRLDHYREDLRDQPDTRRTLGVLLALHSAAEAANAAESPRVRGGVFRPRRKDGLLPVDSLFDAGGFKVTLIHLRGAGDFKIEQRHLPSSIDVAIVPLGLETVRSGMIDALGFSAEAANAWFAEIEKSLQVRSWLLDIERNRDPVHQKALRAMLADRSIDSMDWETAAALWHPVRGWRKNMETRPARQAGGKTKVVGLSPYALLARIYFEVRQLRSRHAIEGPMAAETFAHKYSRAGGGSLADFLDANDCPQAVRAIGDALKDREFLGATPSKAQLEKALIRAFSMTGSKLIDHLAETLAQRAQQHVSAKLSDAKSKLMRAADPPPS